MSGSETLTAALERAQADDATANVFDLIARQRPELESLLPAGVSVERFTGDLLAEIRRRPRLLACSPGALLGAALRGAQLTVPVGPLGVAHLITDGDDAVLVLGYRGLAELCYRSGLVRSITAGTVRDGDRFEYRHGTRAALDHVPAGPPDERLPAAYYAVAVLKTGGTLFAVLYPDEVDAERQRRHGWRDADSPWSSDFDTMAHKVALRRLCELLPLSSPLALALYWDEQPAPAFEERLPTDAAGE